MRLDHAFIVTRPGAPEADQLTKIGLQEGTSNTHPGQGTANRRFFFDDFGLELVFFTDENEARAGPGNVIQSLNRMKAEDGSPLGLVFREIDDFDAATFPGFPYQPVYFDDGQYFIVGSNADELNEPTCVLMPSNLPQRPPQNLSAAPFEHVTLACVSTPAVSLSPALAKASQADRVEIRSGQDHLLELEFGYGQYARSYDLRPDLPLIIRC